MHSATRRCCAAALVLAGASCTTAGRRTPVARAATRAGPLRVALAGDPPAGRVAATGAWRLADRGGSRAVASLRSVDTVTVVAGEQVSVRVGTRDLGRLEPPLLATPAQAGALIRWGDHRYRGAIAIRVRAGRLHVVNHVALEDYLRGVVPLELGGDAPPAALRAQAVAARSYAVGRRTSRADSLAPDLTATVRDQMYGGVDAERSAADDAIAATAGEVLMFGGRLASTPYHSACGGSTEDAAAVWATAGAPYLRPVSDEIPGTRQSYCGDAPLYTWTRRVTAADVAARITGYGRGLAASGRVRDVVVDGHTLSGRVAAVVVRTDEGETTLRGTNIRNLLRASGGAILPSTYFSLGITRDAAGAVRELVLRGRGNGHGVGLCQWGAIGRARAGQTYRAILQTYYPGTTLGTVD